MFRDSFVDSGTAVGPVAVFGARVPMGNVSIGGEVRYQKAEGDLDERDFLGPKLDLGGFHYVGRSGSASEDGRLKPGPHSFMAEVWQRRRFSPAESRTTLRR